jgi:uncharacterized protein involved in response to NO
MKKFYLLILRAAEKLADVFPDWITGKSEIMDQKYYSKYGATDFRDMIRRNKTHTMAVYLCLAAFFLAVAAFSMIDLMADGSEIHSIKRPDYGVPDKSFHANAPSAAYFFYKFMK